MTSRRLVLAAAGLPLAAVLAAAPAGAATSGAGLYLTGAGSGHGVGMSQYGAAGYALHGVGYQQILRDYYSGTTLGHVSPDRPVTVLLRPSGSAVFSGASSIKGVAKKLNPLATYSVVPAGTSLRVRQARKLVGTFNSPLQVTGPGPLKLIGLGSYRGSFVFRPSPGGNGVMTVNAVGLDDYVQGVVTSEMPAGWPAQALDAQAVAARTYAITSPPIGTNFEVYDTTRSQMYLGVKGETTSGNAAVAATSGQVVEYAGVPVVTYFFASSGGQTESVQNVFALAPAAWLVSRVDPYDDSLNNPYHHWKLDFSLQAAEKRLGKLVEGSLVGIKVLQRGVSPRIMKARVVGTKGSVTVTGVQLRQALSTPSTWMSFTTVSSHGVQTSTTPGATTTLPTTSSTTPSTTTGTGSTTDPSGGSGLGGSLERAALAIDQVISRLRFPATRYAVAGSVFPADPDARVTVQFNAGDAWSSVASGPVTASGRYSIDVADPGSYRVRYDGTTGPDITVG
jgi:stage II sporulation protein D